MTYDTVVLPQVLNTTPKINSSPAPKTIIIIRFYSVYINLKLPLHIIHKHRAKSFSSLLCTRLFLRPTQVSHEIHINICFPTTWSVHDADNAPPFSAEVQHNGAIPPFPQTSSLHSASYILTTFGILVTEKIHTQEQEGRRGGGET